MAELVLLSAPELAALLCSRLCHDIISPVGAINNGLELLDDGGADGAALRLVRDSARKASARLKFARLAFGAAGSIGMVMDTGEAEAVAAAIPKGGKISVSIMDADTEPKFIISATGPMMRVPPKFLELHSAGKLEEAIDAHTIQPYYTLLLAKEASMPISIHAGPEEILLRA